MQRKIGFLLSAGGAACFEGISMAGTDPARIVIFVDRACPAEYTARDCGLKVVRVDGTDRGSLSRTLLEKVKDESVDCLVMLFSRLVGQPLLSALPVLNIHPSLLPAFTGLDGVASAAEAGIPFQGATLHVADEGMDTGPVLAQAICALPAASSVEARQSIAFALKSTLVALVLDWWQAQLIPPEGLGGLARCRLALPVATTPNAFVSPTFVDVQVLKRCENLLSQRFARLTT